MKKALGGLFGVALLLGGIYFASELVWEPEETNGGEDGNDGEETETKELTVNINGEGWAELKVDGEWKGPHESGTYEFPQGSSIEVNPDPAIGYTTDAVIPKENFVLDENKSVSLYFSMQEF